MQLRKAARELMTLDEQDPRRIYEGSALIRRIVRLGLLKDSQQKLDYVLGLTTNQFMERRLQTMVMHRQLARSIHHARVMIRQRHIAVGKNNCNIPSFMVRTASEQHIQLAPTSVLKTGLPGRLKRKKGTKKDDE